MRRASPPAPPMTLPQKLCKQSSSSREARQGKLHRLTVEAVQDKIRFCPRRKCPEFILERRLAAGWLGQGGGRRRRMQVGGSQRSEESGRHPVPSPSSPTSASSSPLETLALHSSPRISATVHGHPTGKVSSDKSVSSAASARAPKYSSTTNSPTFARKLGLRLSNRSRSRRCVRTESGPSGIARSFQQMLENLVARLPTSDLNDPPKPSTSSELCNVARDCEHKWYVHKGRHIFYAAAHNASNWKTWHSLAAPFTNGSTGYLTGRPPQRQTGLTIPICVCAHTETTSATSPDY